MPPVVWIPFNQFKAEEMQNNRWTGDYATWQEAEALSTGYDAGNILENVARSTRLVVDGKYPYERDSILFDKIEHNWPLLVALLHIHQTEGKLAILDFGGSLGSVYRQCKPWLKGIKNLKWIVVEQTHYVNLGTAEFEDDILKFNHSIEEAYQKHEINCVLFSCVLQYVADPYALIQQVRDLKIPHLILDRQAVTNSPSDLITIQHVPASFFEAKLPHRFLSGEKISNVLEPDYECSLECFSMFDNSYLHENGTLCEYKLLKFDRI